MTSFDAIPDAIPEAVPGKTPDTLPTHDTDVNDSMVKNANAKDNQHSTPDNRFSKESMSEKNVLDDNVLKKNVSENSISKKYASGSSESNTQTWQQAHWVEWQRIECLCQCLQHAKDGPPTELLNALQQSQASVEQFRSGPWWKKLNASITHFALDVLCCIYAPHIVARIGWMYQELQPNRQTQPSEGLLSALLAIPDSQLSDLKRCLRELESAGFIERQSSEPFTPIFPDKMALARLMGWTQESYAPPGAFAVHSKANWDDLILPDEQQAMLEEYLHWIRFKKTVEVDWQGEQTGGPVALFTGPPGTGKTFAASVIANELHWPLFRVDLSSLVSKYIGETEKNISRLFDATHGKPLVLQFDEVDALMGKRGELKEARDRYANMEVSYLLSRIEQHQGPCILTTNLRSQIDKAFCRRFQIVVEFARPTAVQRLKLWQRLIPKKAPLANEFDWQLIADSVNLTGGQIKNAALHAAYLAAAQSTAISLHHIAIATFRELSKTQTQVNPNLLGDLAAYLDASPNTGQTHGRKN